MKVDSTFSAVVEFVDEITRSDIQTEINTTYNVVVSRSTVRSGSQLECFNLCIAFLAMILILLLCGRSFIQRTAIGEKLSRVLPTLP